MTRKMILLNIVLLAILGLVCWRFRQQFLQMKAHEAAVLRKKPPAAPPPELAVLPKQEKLQGANYIDIALKNLFSKDRNPEVIPPPPPAPPPPKPVPAFPVARGVMFWDGQPATILLSEKAGGTQKAYHPGDRIGDWKIVSVTNQHVTFEWEGKQFQKRIDELLDKSLVALAEAPPQQAAPVNTPAAQTKSLADARTGMGIDVGAGMKAGSCTDGVAAGTVRDGYKKVVSPSPFGDVCRWEVVR